MSDFNVIFRCCLGWPLLTEAESRNDVQTIFNGDLHKALPVCHDQLGVLVGFFSGFHGLFNGRAKPGPWTPHLSGSFHQCHQGEESGSHLG